MLISGAAAAVAARRMRHIVGSVVGRDAWRWRTPEVRLLNTASGEEKTAWSTLCVCRSTTNNNNNNVEPQTQAMH